MFTINVHHFHHLGEGQGGEILAELDKIGRQLGIIMATQQELIDTLTAVNEQQTKTAGEIVALQASMDTLQQTITALEEEVANAGSPSPELVAAVGAVKAKAQEVDDLIPDAPAPVPVP
jgi:predicted  nucleic acid-binding Zn-ribbon protein